MSGERVAAQHCPRDGQNIAWHMQVGGTHQDGSPRTNGEFVGCDFGAEPHGSMPWDYCPVCKSPDVTFPIGSTWIKCRGCDASWNASRRALCHVIGCVEHIDGMHVDAAGDAVVHVGCAVCSALPHHRTPPDSAATT